MIKKILLAILTAHLFLVTGCSHHDENPNVIVVGTIEGPETELMEAAKEVAKRRYGLEIKIVTYKDYGQVNPALINKQIDANAFQDLPYLKEEMKRYGYYSLVAVGNTFLYPMGLYSYSLNGLSNLKPGATVYTPDTDTARSLLLLQSAGLIKLNSNDPLSITHKNIIDNPNNLQIIEANPSHLTQDLHHIVLVAINTNYAKLANLSPSHNALFVEPSNPTFMNLIVVREENQYNPKVKKLVAAYQSEPVREKAKALFGNDAIAGF